MCKRGESVTRDAIAADLAERDARDRTRTQSPLVPAADAVIFDTSELDRDEAIAAAIALVEKRITQS